jgi:photosystem II stability/assembly factor-like uncharacterized protein
MREKMITKNRIFKLFMRLGLFTLILGLGTLTALMTNETEGLAATALPAAPVQSMATADEVLYASMTGAIESPPGLYRSLDNGYSWQFAGSGPDQPIQALTVHPVDNQVLYAGTNGGPYEVASNLWVSPDGGQNWRQFYMKLPAGTDSRIPDVTTLAVDPKHPDEFYIGTAGQGIYRYYAAPEGYGYELFGDVSLPHKYVKGLLVSPDSQVYALTTEGLLVISETGDTWRKIESLPDLAVSLAVDPTNPQTLYAGTAGYGAYRSTDGGQTWTGISEGLGWQPGIILRVSAISIDQANPNHLVLAAAFGVGSQLAGGGVYESFDQGQSWVKLAESPSVITSLKIQAGGVYAATAQGLVRYGQPLTPPEQSPLTSLRALAQPSGRQLLILSLTIVLAALILMGRVEWLVKPKMSHS